MAKILRGVDPIERFNQKYVVNPDTDCWEWQDNLIDNGYGRLKVNGKYMKAHRFSYQYYVGPLQDGYVICHNCQNKKCVNFKHLRQDTQSSNCIDIVKIKKQRSQVLSEDEVIQIKKELKDHYRGQLRDLAHFYKVDPVTISNIKTGRTWSHVKI